MLQPRHLYTAFSEGYRYFVDSARDVSQLPTNALMSDSLKFAPGCCLLSMRIFKINNSQAASIISGIPVSNPG